MADLMQRDPKVVCCTAAMPDGTGVNKVLPKFPDRSWDTGICESHAMDMMAGLAKTGWKPFFAVYSTFLQRAFDQAFQEVALQGLPVRLCLDRAGLVGGDGAVHHGFCDIALLRALPGAALMAAIDEASLRGALEFMRGYEEGLSAVRYPRDTVSELLADLACPAFELGKARCLTRELEDLDGARPDVAILAYGVCAMTALQGAATLAGEAKVSVYDARFAKPVDERLVRELLTRRIPVITMEEHALAGGFGAGVLEASNAHRLDTSIVTRLGMPDSWIGQDPRSRQLAEAGLDESAIRRAVLDALDRAVPDPTAEPKPAHDPAHRHH
jgi:1-deoxy-D-xylulose-5-phosphate synthase